MNKRDQDTLLLERLLDKYKFARPVPEDIQDEILASKKKNLVRVLKTVGAFSALQGVFLSVYFWIKKLGIGIPIAKFLITAVTLAAVTYGGYYALTTRGAEDLLTGVKPGQGEKSGGKGMCLDEITLYNGRIIEGTIISRGARYRVKTGDGIVDIPRAMIKVIKPLREERESGGDSRTR
ncbi:MAG: hypothetical protein KA369_18325 [Spirochaetes bacterium]|nr:hypothetical protein [Spirochaetota bacterium]